jgi:GNAT superfamily N-acetyltransferase
MRLTFAPLTPDRWPDLEALFGPRGACGGCWCMWWRLPRSQWDRHKGDGNRRALRKLVRSGRTPGILAYDREQPAGWCAVEPRESYPVLDRSRVLARVDDRPVWSITCLFVKRGYRRKGVGTALLKAAVKHARAHGARCVEGYPSEPRSGRLPDAFAFTGTVSGFKKAGFKEVARRSPTRPIMRKG